MRVLSTPRTRRRWSEPARLTLAAVIVAAPWLVLAVLIWRTWFG